MAGRMRTEGQEAISGLVATHVSSMAMGYEYERFLSKTNLGYCCLVRKPTSTFTTVELNCGVFWSAVSYFVFGMPPFKSSPNAL